MRVKQRIVYVLTKELWYDSFNRLKLSVDGERPARGIVFYPEHMTLDEFLQNNAQLLEIDLEADARQAEKQGLDYERFALFKGDPYKAQRPIFVSGDTFLGESFDRQFLVIYRPPYRCLKKIN